MKRLFSVQRTVQQAAIMIVRPLILRSTITELKKVKISNISLRSPSMKYVYH